MTKARRYRRIPVISGIIAALALAVAVPAFAVNSAIIPVAKDKSGWTARHESMNQRVKQGNANLIWIGDSIIEHWEGPGKAVWEKYYGDRQAVNLGISGDRTEHVLWRLDHGNVDGISPRLAIVMIGQNNYRSNTAEEIGEGIIAVVKKVREKLPDTKVLLLAIFPLGEKPDANREKLAKASEIASKTADGKNVFYMDINRAFLEPDGRLSKSVMPDFEHPNEQGHEIWAETIEPVVAQLLAETAAGKTPHGFVSLFNGKDLAGWEQVGGEKPSWHVENGILFTDGEGGGWLSSKREYADMELSLEYRVPVNGNSGVFFHSTHQDNPTYTGNEIQVLDDYGDEYKTLQPWQYCGSIYSTVAPLRRMTRPAGEWQSMYIRVEGPQVTVVLNGTTIVDANLNEHLEGLEHHPGLKRTSGYIGLQNHTARVDFRNIFMHELKPAAPRP